MLCTKKYVNSSPASSAPVTYQCNTTYFLLNAQSQTRPLDNSTPLRVREALIFRRGKNIKLFTDLEFTVPKWSTILA